MDAWQGAAQLTGKNGGGTFTRGGEAVNFESGYIVGGVIPGAVFPLSGKLERVLRAFARQPGVRYVGTWIHDGAVFVDAAEHVIDREAALKLGAMRSEIAIWDCGNACEILIEGSN